MDANRNNQVLMVDDDEHYTHLVRRALLTCQPPSALKSLLSGTDLLLWLKTSQLPDLIFLDIDMPGPSGFDILDILKTVKEYKVISVIMISVSNDKRDVSRAFDSGANGYITKPETFAELKKCMQMFSQYWPKSDDLNYN